MKTAVNSIQEFLNTDVLQMTETKGHYQAIHEEQTQNQRLGYRSCRISVNLKLSSVTWKNLQTLKTDKVCVVGKTGR
jgi:hypothetical protein